MTQQGGQMLQFQRKIRQAQEHENAVPLMSAMLHDYWTLRRRNIIAELRMIEDLLGMDQSIPRRQR